MNAYNATQWLLFAGGLIFGLFALAWLGQVAEEGPKDIPFALGVLTVLYAPWFIALWWLGKRSKQEKWANSPQAKFAAQREAKAAAVATAQDRRIAERRARRKREYEQRKQEQDDRDVENMNLE